MGIRRRQPAGARLGGPVDEEYFGRSLAAGHFTGRASADLAIGVVSDSAVEEFGGAVNVLYGSPRGLTAKGNQIFTRRTRGLAAPNKLDSFLGSGLAAGNFGRNSSSQVYDDLVFHADNEFLRDGLGFSRGVVVVLYGTSSGLSTGYSQSWDWRSPGVKGPPSTRIDGEDYGGSMAVADFGRLTIGAHDDLAAGDVLSPGADEDHYGALSVVHGTGSGLNARGDQLWTVKALGRDDPRFFAEHLTE